jgi:lipocalin
MLGIKEKQISGRKEEEDLKIYRLTVQISKREKEKLMLLAKNRGMSVSDYVRYFCIHKPFMNKFEDEE